MTAVFATTAEECIDALRHAGVRRAVELIVAGEAGHARFVLMRHFHWQLRVAGIRVDEPAP